MAWFGFWMVVVWILLWSSSGEGHNHFKEFLICPHTGEDKRLECDNGEVIDILQATAANLRVIDVLDPCSHFLGSKELILNSWDGWHGVCKKNMTFLSCHRHQSCIVNRIMAEVFLPECPGSAATPGRHSDVLYVRYTCHNSNRLTLPFADDVTSDMFDIVNQGFPDVTPPNHYNVTCSIKPSDEKTKQMRLIVEAKLIEITVPEVIENPSTCRESLFLSLSGEILFCYRGVYHKTLNNIINLSEGDGWNLQCRSDGTIPHRFRFNIEATDVGTSDPVQMTISCINNLATTTTTTTTTTAATTTVKSITSSVSVDSDESSQSMKEDNPTNNLVIGVLAGAALLVVVAGIVAVVVFCRKSRSTTTPSGEQDDSQTSGHLNQGYSASGTVEPYENLPRSYISTVDLQTDSSDRQPQEGADDKNDDPTTYETILVKDEENYQDLLTASRERTSGIYEALFT